MTYRKNFSPGLDLAAVAPSQRLNRRVRWNPTMRPTAAPDRVGTIFLSKGKETHVVWDGEHHPQLVFTGALVLV